MCLIVIDHSTLIQGLIIVVQNEIYGYEMTHACFLWCLPFCSGTEGVLKLKKNYLFVQMKEIFQRFLASWYIPVSKPADLDWFNPVKVLLKTILIFIKHTISFSSFP